MTQPDLATRIEAKWREVAAKLWVETPCHFVAEGDTVPYHAQVKEGLNCPNCNGTDKVRVWPLRKACPSCTGRGTGWKQKLGGFVIGMTYEVEEDISISCPSCDGRGWLPIEDLGTLCRVIGNETLDDILIDFMCRPEFEKDFEEMVLDGVIKWMEARDA